MSKLLALSLSALMTLSVPHQSYSDQLQSVRDYVNGSIYADSTFIQRQTTLKNTNFSTVDTSVESSESVDSKEIIPNSKTSIKLSFTGDVGFGTPFGNSHAAHDYYTKFGPDYFFSSVKEYFEQDDFTVINLENVFTSAKDPMKGKIWAYKADPKYIDILKNSSIEVAGLANNHMQDYRQKGLDDTIELLDNMGIKVIGFNDIIGHDPELGGATMSRTEIVSAGGINVGLVSYLAFIPTVRASYTKVKSDIDMLRKNGADYVIVSAHWGGQYTYTLTPNQKATGPKYIDLGADLVIGNHPHTLQEVTMYKGKRIYNSLGNFMFVHANFSKSNETVILQLELTKDSKGNIVETFNHIPISWTGPTSTNVFKPTPYKGIDAQKLVANRLKVNIKEVELIN